MSLPYGDGEPREGGGGGGGETRTIYMCGQTGYYSLLVHTHTLLGRPMRPALDKSHTQMRPLDCFLRSSIPCLDQMCVHMHGYVLTIEKIYIASRVNWTGSLILSVV